MAASQQSVEDKVADHFDPYEETPPEETQETQEPEIEETQEVSEEEPESEETEEESQQPAYAEVQFDGKDYQVPVELKDALLQGADYTRKTQDVARLQEAADMRTEALKREFEGIEFENSLSEERQTLALIDAQIKEYKTFDVSDLSTEQLFQHKMALDNLKEQRSEIDTAITSKKDEWSKTREKALQEHIEKSSDWLRKSINGWNQDIANSVSQDAISQGYTEEEVNSIIDPRAIKTMWESMMYRKMVNDSAEAKKKASKAPPVIKPGSVKKMPQEVREKLNYKKRMAKLNKDKASDAEKAKAVHDRLMQSKVFR